MQTYAFPTQPSCVSVSFSVKLILDAYLTRLSLGLNQLINRLIESHTYYILLIIIIELKCYYFLTNTNIKL